MTGKAPLPEVFSPLGIAKYAWLSKPDTKFAKDGGGDYKTRILIDDTEEHRAWVKQVIEKGKLAASAKSIKLKKNFKTPFILPEDVDEDDFIPDPETGKALYDEDHKGRIWFEAKSKFKPGLIDAAKQELPEDVFVMSGDRIKAKFFVNPYDGLGTGISFRLIGVQLIEKNTTFSGDRKPNLSGFDEVEDGYRAPTKDEEEEF